MMRVTSATSDKTDKNVSTYLPRVLFRYTIQVVVRGIGKKAARDAFAFASLSEDDGRIGRSNRLDAASRETRGTPRDAKRRLVSRRYTRSLPRIRARFSVVTDSPILYPRTRALNDSGDSTRSICRRHRRVSSRRARRIKAGISADEHRS